MSQPSPLPLFDEASLSAIWDAIASTRNMVGMFDSSVAEGGKFMVSAFGTSREQELFVQGLDGDTMFDDGHAPTASFRRVRASSDAAWSAWETCKPR